VVLKREEELYSVFFVFFIVHYFHRIVCYEGIETYPQT